MSNIAIDITGDDSTLKEALADAVGSIKNMAGAIEGISANVEHASNAAEHAAGFEGLHLIFDVLKESAHLLGEALHGAWDFIKDATGEAIKAQVSFTRFEAIMRANAGAVGLTKGELAELGETMSKTTRFSAGMVRSAETMLLTFQNVKGDNFERAIKLAGDLAETMGTDLQSAAFTLGKALEEPEQGMMALRRAGIILSDEQKEQIKAFTEAGESAKAQAEILDILQGKVGGVAEAIGGTVAGKWAIFENALHHVTVTIGKVFMPAVELISPAMTDLAAIIDAIGEKVKEWGESFKESGKSIYESLLPYLRKTIDIMIDFAGGMQAAWQNVGLIFDIAGNSILLSLVTITEDISGTLKGQIPSIFKSFTQQIVDFGGEVDYGMGIIARNAKILWHNFKTAWTDEAEQPLEPIDFSKALHLVVDDKDMKALARPETELEKQLKITQEQLAAALQNAGDNNANDLRKILDGILKKRAEIVDEANKKEGKVLGDIAGKKKEVKDKADKEAKEHDESGDSVGLEELAKKIQAAAAKARAAMEGAGGLGDALKGAQDKAAKGAKAFGAGQPGINVMGVNGLVDLSAPGGPGAAGNRQGAAAAGPNGGQEAIDRALQKADAQQKSRDEKALDVFNRIAKNTENPAARFA